jgi:hypothetical protein
MYMDVPMDSTSMVSDSGRLRSDMIASANAASLMIFSQSLSLARASLSCGFILTTSLDHESKVLDGFLVVAQRQVGRTAAVVGLDVARVQRDRGRGIVDRQSVVFALDVGSRAVGVVDGGRHELDGCRVEVDGGRELEVAQRLVALGLKLLGARLRGVRDGVALSFRDADLVSRCTHGDACRGEGG